MSTKSGENTGTGSTREAAPGRILAFLELEDEVDSFLASSCCSDGAPSNGNTTVVALSLPVQARLKEIGIDYLDSLPFFDNRAHARALEQSEAWLCSIEDRWGPRDAVRDELVFCVRFVLNYLLWLSEIVTEAILQLQPSCLWCPPAIITADETTWALTSKDRFLGALLDRYARDNALRIEIGSGKPTRESPSTGSPHAKVSSSTLRWSRLPLLKWFVARLLRGFSHERDILLVTSPAYGMDRAVREMELESMTFMVLDWESDPGTWMGLRKLAGALRHYVRKPRHPEAFFRVPIPALPVEDSGVRRDQEAIQRSVLDLADRIETEWRITYSYRGLDTAPCVSAKLRTGILRHFLHLTRTRSQLASALASTRPRAVLSPFGTGPFRLLGELCEEKDIPGILVPHGTLAAPHNQLEEIEWRRLSQGLMLSPYRYRVAQTAFAEEHAASFGVEESTFRTGPVLFSVVDRSKGWDLRKRLGLAETTSVIVYAVAQRQRSSMRFQIFQTEDEWLSSFADLIAAANSIRGEDIHLILKLRPAFRIPKRRMASLLPECNRLTVLQAEPFDEVLAASDLLVSFLCTTVEEALIDGIPVVLYDKWKRYRLLADPDCTGLPPEAWTGGAAYYTDDARRRYHSSGARCATPYPTERVQHFRRYRPDRAGSRPLSHHVRKLATRRYAETMEARFITRAHGSSSESTS